MRWATVGASGAAVRVGEGIAAVAAGAERSLVVAPAHPSPVLDLGARLAHRAHQAIGRVAVSGAGVLGEIAERGTGRNQGSVRYARRATRG